MLNLEKLAIEQEKAAEDKADLFDFYHKNWDALVAEIRSLRQELHGPNRWLTEEIRMK